MPGDYIGEGVANADDRTAEIIVAKAAGFIKSTTGYHFVVHEGALGKFLCHDEKRLSVIFKNYFTFYNSLYMTLFLLAIMLCDIIKVVALNNSLKDSMCK